MRFFLFFICGNGDCLGYVIDDLFGLKELGRRGRLVLLSDVRESWF